MYTRKKEIIMINKKKYLGNILVIIFVKAYINRKKKEL